MIIVKLSNRIDTSNMYHEVAANFIFCYSYIINYQGPRSETTEKKYYPLAKPASRAHH